MHERLVTTWFGESLSPLHAACIASWVAAGREAVVYSYRDHIAGLPPGATLLNGEEILPEEKMFFRTKMPSYAHFSDIFRMVLLDRGLGTWCDADFFLLRDLPETDEIMIGRERNGWPCNAVMWMRPGHPIARGVIEAFGRGRLAPWTYAKPRWHAFLAAIAGRPFTIGDLPHGHWGRHPLDYYVRKLRLGDQLLPQDAFFAEETYTGQLFEAGPFDRLVDNPQVKGIHFFNKNGAGAAAVPGSFYAYALDRVRAHLA